MGALALVLGALVAACTADEDHAARADSDDPRVVPPTQSEQAIVDWLAAGYYVTPGWTCEPTPHAAFTPSPHGEVRICANPLAEPDPPAEHAVDSAYVIEIYAGSASVPAGHGVLRHTNEGHDPDSWYWYMHVPADSNTTHDANGLAANGWGLDGPARDYCGACHRMTGSSGHPGHDYIWLTP